MLLNTGLVSVFRMSLQNFPKALPDELLGSVLARSVHQLGVKDDKVALKLLFGSRNVVPSGLMQGHIDMLLEHVGHIWPISSSEVIQRHSLLPLFRPFSTHEKYSKLLADLCSGRMNFGMLRSGINASRLKWTNTFRVCPVCWHEQRAEYGFAVWSRVLQCPGVECCPDHKCLLVDSKISMPSERRHELVGAHQYRLECSLAVAAEQRLVQVADCIKQLLDLNYPFVTPGHWTGFYRQIVKDKGLVLGGRVDHDAIRSEVLFYWGEQQLERWGLELSGDSNWLLSMFRTHRRPFNYLQHLVVLQAFEQPTNLERLFQQVASFPAEPLARRHYENSRADYSRQEYREIWRQLLADASSLKSIRSSAEGARVYSWLYRYDREWLMKNKPAAMARKPRNHIDWTARDRDYARRICRLERSLRHQIDGPRRSQAWYLRQMGLKSSFRMKSHLLPLCRLLLNRYAESVDEYQTRRLASCVLRLMEEKKEFQLYEVERLAGLSKERCRKAARQIIRDHIACWSGIAQVSSRLQA
jgi:hypothetical protein